MITKTKAEMDAQNFLRYAFGETPVGSADNESVDRAYSPELRAFFQGRIGDVPLRWWDSRPEVDRMAKKHVAEFLREIADVLDGAAE